MSQNSEHKSAHNYFQNCNEALQANKLDVYMHGAHVGTLALTQEGTTAFEYSDEWVASGFSISPLSLPLEKRVFLADSRQLDGLFGVFNDSLPDGWGRLLVDRFLREQGIDPFAVSPLVRLAIVGDSGMGALEYRPNILASKSDERLSFDELAAECAKFLATNQSDDLDELFAMGGSSGGARPKVFTRIDGEEWIVKFPSSHDPESIGIQEFMIAKAASRAGIKMPEVRLIPSKVCDGYFATKRFDRESNAIGMPHKIHMVSAGALLETSHRIPNLDYDTLLKLTLHITEDMSQMEAMYRLMAFNVFIGNRDDHSKNFSFLRPSGTEGRWQLSPGYDLTTNSGMNGEHFTTVNGKGRNITVSDVIDVGQRAGIRMPIIRSIVDEVRAAIEATLSDMIDLPAI